jgi:hypothetical protein
VEARDDEMVLEGSFITDIVQHGIIGGTGLVVDARTWKNDDMGVNLFNFTSPSEDFVRTMSWI